MNSRQMHSPSYFVEYAGQRYGIPAALVPIYQKSSLHVSTEPGRRKGWSAAELHDHAIELVDGAGEIGPTCDALRRGDGN